MTESEFLKRFDAHIVRMDAHIVRMDEHIVRTDERLELMRRHDVRAEKLIREDRVDLKGFIRDLVGRNEVVLGDVSRNLAELSEQSRAQTAAILSVLDRLN